MCSKFFQIFTCQAPINNFNTHYTILNSDYVLQTEIWTSRLNITGSKQPRVTLNVILTFDTSLHRSIRTCLRTSVELCGIQRPQSFRTSKCSCKIVYCIHVNAQGCLKFTVCDVVFNHSMCCRDAAVLLEGFPILHMHMNNWAWWKCTCCDLLKV